MGLFTNKKKCCPICGNPTPRLFSTKFENQPICKECAKKLDLPDGTEKNMTLDDFRTYLAVYTENLPLQEIFQTTHRFGVFAHDSLLLDEKNRLLRLKDIDGSWAIEKKYLQSFCIYEDHTPLFRSGAGVLKSYPSDIPARAEALRPSVAQFYLQKQEYERQEQRENAMHRGKETDEERMERQRISNLYRPRFDAPMLFKGFQIELTFSHPYWGSFALWRNAPNFDDTCPNVDTYLKQYRKQVKELHQLAVKLMHMIDPSAGEKQIISAASTPFDAALDTAVDAVAEIRKYKELLEQRLITETEFILKKRQLLGI